MYVCIGILNNSCNATSYNVVTKRRYTNKGGVSRAKSPCVMTELFWYD